MIHKYLRAIGFSKITKRKEINQLTEVIINDSVRKSYVSVSDDDNVLLAEYFYYCGKGFGLVLRGEYDEDNKFYPEHIFPFVESSVITTNEELTVESYVDRCSYAGIVDDLNVGISIIFYLQEISLYLKNRKKEESSLGKKNVSLTGLCDKGRILIPLEKNAGQTMMSDIYQFRKTKLTREALNGDEAAIEWLSEEDMGEQKYVRKKINEEDLFSLVDTSFIPYGIECELYSILGEIIDYEQLDNIVTGEKIFIMTLLVNGLSIKVAINTADLEGEIQIGRRFKGIVWLQGNFEY